MNDAITLAAQAEVDAARRIVERFDAVVRQRDELAACLREVRHGFIGSALIIANPSAKSVEAFAQLTVRIDAALLRLKVRERLDDKLAAERKGDA